MAFMYESHVWPAGMNHMYALYESLAWPSSMNQMYGLYESHVWPACMNQMYAFLAAFHPWFTAVCCVTLSF
jgi:hypothetical protein